MNPIKLDRAYIVRACFLCLSYVLDVLLAELTIVDRSFPVIEVFIELTPKKIQSFSSVDQVKEFILASGSVPDQGIID